MSGEWFQWRCKPARSIQHAKRMQIGLNQRLLLLALVDVLLAHAHDRTQRLHVEPRPFGLSIDIADVVAERLLLLLQPLDPLDEGLELIPPEAGGRLLFIP